MNCAGTRSRARRNKRSATAGTDESRRPGHPADAAPAPAVCGSTAAAPATASSRLPAAGGDAGFLLQQGGARLDAIELLAQFIDAAQHMLGLGARHQVAALMRQVLAEVLYTGPHRGACPCRHAAQAAHEQVRAAASERGRDQGFQIRPEQYRQLAKLLCNPGIAVDAYIAALDH